MQSSRNWFPVGSGIDEETFERRHRFLLIVMLVHIPVLGGIAFFTQFDLHLIWEIGLLVLAGWIGSRPFLSRTVRAAVVSVGLLTSAALLVHVTGGLIEAHFHFFVLLPIVALYQDWRPLAAATVFVATHHAILGIANPDLVFNPSLEMHPLVRTGLHALFVVVEVTLLAFRWRFDQEVLDAQVHAQEAMQEAEKARAIDAESAAAEAEEQLARLSELQQEQESTARDAAERAEQLADEMNRSRVIQEELLQIGRELLEASNRTSSDLTAISDGAREVATSTTSTVDVASEAATSAELGEAAIRDASLAIEQALLRLAEAEQEAQALTEHAKQIDSIVSLVSGIAEQTNLLALNAAIEAARAGEQGRGFSVVASEVKTLAESTSESLQGISELVRSTDAGVGALVATLAAVETAVSQSNTTSVEAETHFSSIAGRIREIVERMAGMSDRVGTFEAATAEIERSTRRLAELAESASNLANATE